MISGRLKKTILKALKLKEFDLCDEMCAYQIPGWDSLNHAIVLTAIEKEYGFRFSMLEILRLRNLGDLQALIDSKVST